MDVWSEIAVGPVIAKNRFMHGALSENCSSESGDVTAGLMECYRETAYHGDLGIIISGLAYVNRQGQKWPHQLGIWRDEQIPGLSMLANMLQVNGSKAFIQLAHAGIYASPDLTGIDAVGPSAIEKYGATPGNRAMTAAEIHDLVEDYARAARRAKDAGFAGVELHAAHGYGLSQFLSSTFNTRTDDYGGSPENRARIVAEILQAIGQAAGGDFPVIIKMNGDDFTDDGSNLKECLAMALQMEKNGAAAIECSGGMNFNPSKFKIPSQKVNPRTLENEAYFRELAKEFKKVLQIPVALVGGIRSLATARKLLQEDYCDIVSMARPLIRSPTLIKKWKEGMECRSDCLSCNKCLEHSRTVGSLTCAIGC